MISSFVCVCVRMRVCACLLVDSVDVILGVGIALLLTTNGHLLAVSAAVARFNYRLELWLLALLSQKA